MLRLPLFHFNFYRGLRVLVQCTAFNTWILLTIFQEGAQNIVPCLTDMLRIDTHFVQCASKWDDGIWLGYLSSKLIFIFYNLLVGVFFLTRVQSLNVWRLKRWWMLTSRSRWPRGLRRGYTTARLAGVTISNLAVGMDVCLLWMLYIVRYRYLWRADPSSRGILPSVCVWKEERKEERKKERQKDKQKWRKKERRKGRKEERSVIAELLGRNCNKTAVS